METLINFGIVALKASTIQSMAFHERKDSNSDSIHYSLLISAKLKDHNAYYTVELGTQKDFSKMLFTYYVDKVNEAISTYGR